MEVLHLCTTRAPGSLFLALVLTCCSPGGDGGGAAGEHVAETSGPGAATSGPEAATFLGARDTPDLLGLGIAFLRHGNIALAHQTLTRAREQSPNDPLVLFYLARATQNMTMMVEAEALYLEALERDPQMMEALLQLSEMYVTEGRFQKALEVLQRMEKSRGAGPNLLYQQGYVRSMMGEFAAAEELLRRSLGLNPSNPHAWYILGLNSQRQGKDQEAVAAFERALQVDNNYIEAWFNLGNSLARLGRTKAAEEALMRYSLENQTREKSFATRQAMLAVETAVEMRLQDGELGKARELLDGGFRDYPGQSWLLRLEGELLLRQGRRPEALQSLQRSAALGSPNAEEHLALAQAFRLAQAPGAAAQQEQVARQLLQSPPAPEIGPVR